MAAGLNGLLPVSKTYEWWSQAFETARHPIAFKFRIRAAVERLQKILDS
jgi:hypothetical protein